MLPGGCRTLAAGLVVLSVRLGAGGIAGTATRSYPPLAPPPLAPPPLLPPPLLLRRFDSAPSCRSGRRQPRGMALQAPGVIYLWLRSSVMAAAKAERRSGEATGAPPPPPCSAHLRGEQRTHVAPRTPDRAAATSWQGHNDVAHYFRQPMGTPAPAPGVQARSSAHSPPSPAQRAQPPCPAARATRTAAQGVRAPSCHTPDPLPSQWPGHCNLRQPRGARTTGSNSSAQLASCRRPRTRHPASGDGHR